MNKKKVNWQNTILAMLLIILIYLILNDFYIVVFKGMAWTWFGFITLFLMIGITGLLTDYFIVEVSNVKNE